MAGKARKFAQLSPQKTRASPAKYVRLTEVDDAEERRERTASKLAKTQQRTQTILNEYAVGQPGASSPNARRLSGFNPDGTVSAMPRMPILANFEEWMKLATDNKINAGNSWNFALIDYFHEMSLLKEGDNINFQKASVTLDGCVKIYTNRVDSVATETGKLLSGLSSGKQAAESTEAQEEGGEEGDEDAAEEDEDGAPRKAKKKTKSSGGSTLVKDFSAIQAKKLDMEFFVDPLFKKTSAEFDEGGAKGLLLNHLCVDKQGRIIFDTSDASHEIEEEEEDEVYDLQLEALGQKFFPELFCKEDEIAADAWSELHICPSLKGFTTDSAVLDIPLLASLAGEAAQQASEADDHDDAPDFGGYEGGFDEGDAGISGVVDVYDTNEDAQFGQVNDVLTDLPTHNMPETRMRPATETVVSHHGTSDQHRMFAQFDDMFSKNWAGPAHWKIARLAAQTGAAAPSIVKKPRKEKEVTSIDFLSAEGEVDEEIIFANGGATTMLPKTQWSSKTRNLLPEDKHFNSEALLSLFMKPHAKLSTRQTMQPAEGDYVDMDENFWAQSGQAAEDAPQVFDANFFQDGEDAGMAAYGGDDVDDDAETYADAKEDFGPTPEPFLEDGEPGATQGSATSDFGNQLQALGKRSKPEYVNFARTAKKVDVHVLKTNIWDKLELVGADEPAVPVKARQSAQMSAQGEERKFTEIVQSLTSVYEEKQMSEISTSFCFICLLHLANEKGLEIVGEDNMRELTVRRDESVHVVEPV